LGATICTPKKPACGLCPWRTNCIGLAKGTHLELPKKLPKKKKPTRTGTAYVARRVDGAYLLETRPENGLLGGMQAWPTTDWSETAVNEDAPIHAEWKTHAGEVRHTFTHFHLKLQVKTALVLLDRKQTRGEFVQAADFAPAALPTVMRKVFDLVRSE